MVCGSDENAKNRTVGIRGVNIESRGDMRLKLLVLSVLGVVPPAFGSADLSRRCLLRAESGPTSAQDSVQTCRAKATNESDTPSVVEYNILEALGQLESAAW